MNSGPTAERVYDAIKRRIGERAFRPGDRLDPAQLGSEVNSSVTPVRDALHLLTGEGLVEARTGEGFHLPQIDAPGLEDLYAWNNDVLLLAMKGWGPPPSQTRDDADILADEDSLFASIAARSNNSEHVRTAASLNDRLRAVRSVERLLFSDVEAELASLRRTLVAGDRQTLRSGLAAYHRRRRRAASEIVRLLYRLR